MDNNLSSSSLVFDKNNSRFNILNIYDDDNDDDIIDHNIPLSNSIKIRKKFKETVIKKEEEKIKTNKCYCNIM